MSQQPAAPKLSVRVHICGCCLLAVQFISSAVWIGTTACQTWMHHLVIINNFPSGSAELISICDALDSMDFLHSTFSIVSSLLIPFSVTPSLHNTKYQKIFCSNLLFTLICIALSVVYLKILEFSR